MNIIRMSIKALVYITFGLSLSFADTLSVKEQQYSQSIIKHIYKNQAPANIYILGAKEAAYLNEKKNLLESHSNLSEKDKVILVAEHKKKFFGGTNTPVNPEK